MNPLPLIESQYNCAGVAVGDTSRYGYILLTLTWVSFIVTINTLFSVWKFVIDPLKPYDVYSQVYFVCETVDYYVLALWGIYVLAWWWALVSWAGLKLFRHSKGLVN